MSEHTRRQFLGSAGSVVAATVLVPGALAAGRPVPGTAQFAQANPGCTLLLLHLSIGDLPRGNGPGPGSEGHHQSLQARGPSRSGARPPGTGVLPQRGGRRRGRTRQCESVSGLADHPADVHRQGGARRVHDHPRHAHAGAAHLRAGRAPAAGSSRGGTGQRASRRGPRAHVHPVGAGRLLHRRGRRRERHGVALVPDGLARGRRSEPELPAARPRRRVHAPVAHAPSPRPELEAAAADPQELGRPDPPAGSSDREGREARGQARVSTA